MKHIACLMLLALGVSSHAQTVSKEVQIKVALLAAPEELRTEATVLGYNDKNELVVLKQGTNEMICLGDDPSQKGINVSCYHQELEPFMARGRELKAQGKTFQEIFDIREAEAKTGKLKMPEQASTLFVYTVAEEDFNAQTGEVKNGYLRYVIYIPWATQKSTGLPLKPDAPGMPWIMDPGTHRAHIMINPPRN